MFIATLFTVARTWKQPKWPSTDEWIKKMWHIYTMAYAAPQMSLEIITEREVSQNEKDKCPMMSLMLSENS